VLVHEVRHLVLVDFLDEREFVVVVVLLMVFIGGPIIVLVLRSVSALRIGLLPPLALSPLAAASGLLAGGDDVQFGGLL
jgi:hypothetical protein